MNEKIKKEDRNIKKDTKIYKEIQTDADRAKETELKRQS